MFVSERGGETVCVCEREIPCMKGEGKLTGKDNMYV